jgi:hypothetical protein
MTIDSIFLNRQLNHIQKEVIKQDFPEMLMMSGAAIDISSELPAAARTYTFNLFNYVGSAAILANGAQDIPMVNAYAEEKIGQIRTLANGYAVTLDDLEGAAYAGVNITAEFGIGAREIMERTADLLAYTGDTRYNLYGFLNHPNVPTSTVLNDGNSNGGVNSTRWMHKTADQIYRDLTRFATSMRTQTKGVYGMQVIVMPEDQFSIINTTPYPAISSGETILSFFMKTQGRTLAGVQSVFPMAYLEGKGAGNSDLMVGYQKRKDRIKLHIPMDFRQEPMQQMDFSFKVMCRMKTGGVQVTKPLSIRYSTGI